MAKTAIRRPLDKPDLGHELSPFVVADEQGIHTMIAQSVAADDELLLPIEFELDPGTTALTRS